MRRTGRRSGSLEGKPRPSSIQEGGTDAESSVPSKKELEGLSERERSRRVAQFLFPEASPYEKEWLGASASFRKSGLSEEEYLNRFFHDRKQAVRDFLEGLFPSPEEPLEDLDRLHMERVPQPPRRFKPDVDGSLPPNVWRQVLAKQREDFERYGRNPHPGKDLLEEMFADLESPHSSELGGSTPPNPPAATPYDKGGN